MENKKRLIDADALGIGKANPDVFEKPEYAHGWNSAIDIIQNAPTVDAVPVVHGRWEAYPSNRNIRCTNCKMEFSLMHMSYTRNYCPNCGATMDLEDE